MKSELKTHFQDKQIEGTIDEISETPSFLKSLISSTKRFVYDSENNMLKTNFPNDDESIALNELLKNKPLEIKEIPLAEVKSIEHWTYEQM